MNNSKSAPEWTGFQESRPYGPKYDLRTDFVMVYGITDDMQGRIEGWKKAGYTVHLMTGVSWGEYQSYLYGHYDGRNHWDEAQMDRHGQHLLHGKDVPYMVPTISFANYLTSYIKKAIDCGVEAIHMEEPEFWAVSGYSEAFKREWLNIYGEAWIPPHTSADAQYRASKLKAMMYYRTMDRICSEMKEYALVTYGRTVRFYIPTHSLINYTQWRIVSPEAMFTSMPACDGFIAQIWTGTARTPNVYRGVRRERTFETAYLEYGMMQELTRGTGREMWFLHDPIEDNPRHTWKDYEHNYMSTVVASLLHPGVCQYEVCPWPYRVFEGSYPKDDGNGKERIPPDYATVLLTVMHMLGELHRYDEEIALQSGTTGIGLCLANSAMYQRGDVDTTAKKDSEYETRYDGTVSAESLSLQAREQLDWSAFYGLALPLLKCGMPVRPVQLDNVLGIPGYLDDYRILILSYEFMKPEHPGIHLALAQWVNEGGILIYVGDGSDPYHHVREWWNRPSGRASYERPEEHLFESLGLDRFPHAGMHPVGRGAAFIHRIHPAVLSRTVEGARWMTDCVKHALNIRGEECDYKECNVMSIKRGPYLMAHALDETEQDQPVPLEGTFIDLFHAELPLLHQVKLQPGANVLLYDLRDATNDHREAKVLVSSSRVRDQRAEQGRLYFISESPSDLMVSTRVYMPEKPNHVTIDGEKADYVYDAGSGTVLIRHPGKPGGVNVLIE